MKLDVADDGDEDSGDMSDAEDLKEGDMANGSIVRF